MDQATAIRRRERLAWAVLLSAFGVFCLLALGIPLAVRWYYHSALSARQATLEVISGTVLLLEPGARREISAQSGAAVGEGARVRTTADAQALLALPDGSNLRLWPESTVVIQRLAMSRFTQQQTIFRLYQASGVVRYEVAVPVTEERRFEVQTPQASALLREGSYRIEVNERITEISVRAGSASVSAQDHTLELLQHERTVVAEGQAPAAPLPALRNLIVNGDFSRGLEGWQYGSRNEEDGVAATVQLRGEDGRTVVRFARTGSNKHGEGYLYQALNRDVTDFQVLRLSFDLKLTHQSLSGGGWLGSEYPLLVRLRYRDAASNEQTWVRGFYFRNEENRLTTNGVAVPAQMWVPFTVNLFDPEEVSPRPAVLLWVEIEASGWEFESYVTNIQLLAE